MKKKQLWLALALVLGLVLLCAGSAFAAAGSLDFKMELSSQEFFEPKTITISFTVTNTSNSEMPGPVMLYYPDGTQVEEFGAPVLGAGSSKNWSGPWSVTQEELVAGKISFKVIYPEVDENGELKQIPVAVSKHIQYKGAEPKIDVSRSIVPQTAQEGQDVSIVYEITNTGSADVTGLTIQETINNKEKAAVGAVKSGETVKYTFTTQMKKKDLTSQATITYKAGGKTYTAKVDAAVIKYGKVNLTATLTADKKGGVPGEIVKLTLKLKNSGTTDFTDVLVTDEKLGIVFSGQTVKAGDTLTLEKEITITETQELVFTIRGDNGAGGQIEAATGKVKIVARDPNQEIVLDVNIEPDREAVYQIPGGIVKFKVTVTNKSAVDVENVSVKARDITLHTFEKIPAGESKSFTRDTELSMAGTYQFTANVKDQLGETVSFESNKVVIELTDPPADPTPTPVVLPARPAEITVPPVTEGPDRAADAEKLDNIDRFAETAKWILAAVAAVLFGLLVIGAARRVAQKSQSAKAIDHLDGGSYRDYSALPKGRKRNEVASGEEPQKAGPAAEQPPYERPSQGTELMAETLQRLHAKRSQESTQAPAAAPAPEAPAAAPEPAAQAETPAEAPAQYVQSADEAAHRRRSRR